MPTPADCLQRAIDFFNLKQYADAAAIAQDGLAQSSDDGPLWQVLGASLWFRNEHDAARTALEIASLLTPLHPLPQRILAELYAHMGKTDLAVLMFRHLLDSNRCPTELLSGIAASLNRLRKFKLALKACRILTDRRPDHHQGHFGTAFYLSCLKMPPRYLVAPLRRAFDLAPDLLHYRLNLAFVLAALKRGDTARSLIASVDLAKLHCPVWVDRMKALFDEVGDRANVGACDRRLQELAKKCCSRIEPGNRDL